MIYNQIVTWTAFGILVMFTVYTIFTDYSVCNVLLLILLFVVVCVPKYCLGRFRTLLETGNELLSKKWKWSGVGDV